ITTFRFRISLQNIFDDGSLAVVSIDINHTRFEHHQQRVALVAYFFESVALDRRTLPHLGKQRTKNKRMGVATLILPGLLLTPSSSRFWVDEATPATLLQLQLLPKQDARLPVA